MTARQALRQPTGALVDYFRCPGSVAEFELTAALSDEPGYFSFGPDTICYGKLAAGRPSAQAAGPLYDALADVSAAGSTVRLPFDPDEIIANLRHERYHHNGHRHGSGLSANPLAQTLYYWVRPILGVPMRRHVQRVCLRDWKNIPFPHWPVDRTAEWFLERLLLLSMKAQGVDVVPFVWFWPEGAASCTVMTHDVETLAGRDFCSRLMDLDEEAGIKSAFQLVPERRYPVPETLLDEIRARGFEINVHDLDHGGRLFSDREHFFRSAGRINEYGRKWGALGFRSAALYRNQAWFDALDFSYEMSVPSVAHLDPQRGGCCSIMPFFIGRLLELPVTTIQDYSLFHILNDYSIDVWQCQTASIAQQHGLASFIVHPDYLAEQRALTTYGALLEHLVRMREQHRTWIALPGEVNRWWRDRSQMTIARDGSRWRIEGPGKERARLAFATVAGDTLAFAIDDQN